ncbi:MAG: DUF5679 domain-containing protein [Candidatus Methylomirabilales bacterium]
MNWVKAGAPHERDARGHIWIHGRAFAEWLDSKRRPRSRRSLSPEQGYCLRCNQTVQMENPRPRKIDGLTLLTGSCPNCGGKVNRGIKGG